MKTIGPRWGKSKKHRRGIYKHFIPTMHPEIATIKRFEDIRSWQTTRELTNLVYQATKNDHLSKD